VACPFATTPQAMSNSQRARTKHIPPTQELRQERAACARLTADSSGRDAAHAQARGQVATLTAERNSLSSLVETLRGQLASKGTDLAAQLEAAAALAADKAVVEARAREADRAKSRLDLEVAQLREVGGGRRRGCVVLGRWVGGLGLCCADCSVMGGLGVNKLTQLPLLKTTLSPSIQINPWPASAITQ